MCLILFAYEMHAEHQLIVGANRDEFYERPTAPLDFWEDYPDVLAGRDIRGGGTWMGVTRTGRFAGITNFRDPAGVKAHAPSRGALVSDFLCGNDAASTYLEKIHRASGMYNGFNLIIGDCSGLFYYSNYQNTIQRLSAGLYGFSNRLINTPWPKVEKGKAALKRLITTPCVDGPAIFNILKDDTFPPDHLLPDTGVGMEWERILSPLFIKSKTYGTRSSSVVFMNRNGKIQFTERSFAPPSDACQDADTRHFSFQQTRGNSWHTPKGKAQ